MFQAGFTAVHLAGQNGHLAVLEVLRSSQSLKISSKRLGMTALHMAAYCGQTGTCPIKEQFHNNKCLIL